VQQQQQVLLQAHDAALIAGVLRKNSSLTQLAMPDQDFGSRGASYLASGLVHSRSITELDLNGNGIGDAGLVSIAGTLTVNGQVLGHLHVARNGIGEVGMTALADALWNTEIVTTVTAPATSPKKTGGKPPSLSKKKRQLKPKPATTTTAVRTSKLAFLECDQFDLAPGTSEFSLSGFTAAAHATVPSQLMVRVFTGMLNRNSTIQALDVTRSGVDQATQLLLGSSFVNSPVCKLEVVRCDNWEVVQETSEVHLRQASAGDLALLAAVAKNSQSLDTIEYKLATSEGPAVSDSDSAAGAPACAAAGGLESEATALFCKALHESKVLKCLNGLDLSHGTHFDLEEYLNHRTVSDATNQPTNQPTDQARHVSTIFLVLCSPQTNLLSIGVSYQ
jgi:hypothetical protein